MQDVITLKNKSGKDVGWMDEWGNYHTTRDYMKSQIFQHPKYKNAMAVDIDIIKEIIRRNEDMQEGSGMNKKIIIEVLNFEDKPFFVESEIKFFIENSEVFNYDNKSIVINNERVKIPTYYSEQRRMPMNLWIRVYPNQRKLSIELPSIAKTK